MQDPETYERERPNNGVDKLVDKYLPPLVSSLNWDNCRQGNVLDYGCGAGSSGFRHIFPKVLQTDGTLYSVDVSENMLNFAKEKYSNPRINYAVGDILQFEEFPFKDVPFDKIISCNVFHFIVDLRKALKGLHAILNETGQLAFICCTASSNAFKMFKALQKTHKWGKYMKSYDNFYPAWSVHKEGTLRQHMEAILEETGFKISYLNTEVIRHPMKYEPYIDILLTVNPCLLQIPVELHEILKADMRQLLFELEGVSGGCEELVLGYDYIIYVANKISK